MRRRITIDEWPAVVRRWTERIGEDAKAAAYEAVTRGEAFAVARTGQKDLVHMGHYKNSWKSGPTSDGAMLRNDAPHAGVIEYGRRPNRPGPPYDPILEWVVRKLVARGEVPPDQAERVARAIQLSIHRKGTPPHFVLRATWQRVRRYFRRELRRRQAG